MIKISKINKKKARKKQKHEILNKGEWTRALRSPGGL